MVTPKKSRSFWARLNPFRLSEAGESAESSDSGPKWHFAETGSTGTESYMGYAAEEYLQRLRGRERADIFDKMRRSDAQVVMCLSAVKNPIKSASWTVEAPENATEEEKQDAELVEHLIFRDLQPGWNRFLSEILTMIEFGHSVFEITHRVAVQHPRFGSYNAFRMGFRSQRTIDRWNLCTKTGGLASISQLASGDLDRNVDIPACYLLAFALGQEGSNFEGMSMLRSCYGPWLRKDTYLKLNAIGIEKFAIPTPLAKVPPNKTSGPEFDLMTEVLEAYTSHEKGYITYPEGFEIKIEPSAYDPEKVETSINNEDKRMTKAFLANFLELGTGGSGGAYALGQDLSDFMLNSIVHLGTEICDTINRCLIPQMVLMNRGPRDRYPTLKVAGIADKAGKELGELLKALVDGRVIQPDARLEEAVRKRAGLPVADPATARAAPAPTAGGLTMAERLKRWGI